MASNPKAKSKTKAKTKPKSTAKGQKLKAAENATTNMAPVLPVREDVERTIYTHSPGDLSLEQTRDAVAIAFADQIAESKKPSTRHAGNGDEEDYQDQAFLGSFSKGLPRQSRNPDDATACLPDPNEFVKFRTAIHTGNFFVGTNTPTLGPNKQLPGQAPDDRSRQWNTGDFGTRGWESPETGLALEPHGPDSHAVTMAPAPKLESSQLAFEMAEVYWLALLRDEELSKFNVGSSGDLLIEAIDSLNKTAYADKGFRDPSEEAKGIPSRTRQTDDNGKITTGNVFRGVTAGDVIGPYLSQFMLIGAPAPADGGDGKKVSEITKGEIPFGAQIISQKLRPHKKYKTKKDGSDDTKILDFMQDRASYVDVQEGANVGSQAKFEMESRFLSTPRDMATYVHYDALYQAYLNACLILLGFKAPVDQGIAYHQNHEPGLSADLNNVTDGFALFGGPHILTLVTEVATRALKAVRYQKFNVHCRLRPEAVGGLVEFMQQPPHNIGTILENNIGTGLVNRIRAHNQENSENETALLPMAFPEGSPMHPAYGAGHATVAGACVTMLKAFFDEDAVLVKSGAKDSEKIDIISDKKYRDNTETYSPVAYVSNFDKTGDVSDNTKNGDGLNEWSELNSPLTVGGELDKLAANISIARNMAGVHFYTDYIDSLTMGEEIAIQMLKESMSAFQYYPDAVRPSLSFTKFLGGTERISV